MARNIGERIGNEDEFYRRMGENWSNNLRVSMPGIIQSFDPVTQTVSVKPAIREKIKNLDLSETSADFPVIPDVPIVLPRAGGFVLTLPVSPGDECLIVFADMCIDAWWASGGIQNQLEKRRHDLSDAFAILGTWSQPKVINNYSTNSIQLRNKIGNSYIEIKDSEINIVSQTVKINGSVIP